jgi:hypothetical protein
MFAGLTRLRELLESPLEGETWTTNHSTS